MPRRKQPPTAKSVNDAAHLATMENRAKVLDMKRAGFSLREMERAIGLDHTTCKRYLDEAMADLQAAQNEKAEAARAVELDRLDKLHMSIWANATGKDVSPDVRNAAIDRLVRIADRRAKLLGLDAPTKMDMQVSGNVRLSYSQLVSELDDDTDDANPSA